MINGIKQITQSQEIDGEGFMPMIHKSMIDVIKVSRELSFKIYNI